MSRRSCMRCSTSANLDSLSGTLCAGGGGGVDRVIGIGVRLTGNPQASVARMPLCCIQTAHLCVKRIKVKFISVV